MESRMNLKELLTAERVSTNVQVDGWEDAVRAIGRLMVDTNVVEERYVDGMINTAKELGPYIVIAPGLALPHSRPEDGVLQPCMALITLEPPVDFGNPDNDPVNLVIAFGAVDNEQHVEALRDMATILSEPSNLAALRAAKTKDEILKVMWSTPVPT
jgi:mannitol/fructose-specific phosphotransferase system IIA component (Ntr-type)